MRATAKITSKSSAEQSAWLQSWPLIMTVNAHMHTWSSGVQVRTKGNKSRPWNAQQAWILPEKLDSSSVDIPAEAQSVVGVGGAETCNRSCARRCPSNRFRRSRVTHARTPRENNCHCQRAHWRQGDDLAAGARGQAEGGSSANRVHVNDKG